MAKPHITLTVPERDHVQLGKMAVELGSIETRHTAECWACGEFTNKRKPGLVNDIWICPCGVTWELPTVKG